MLKTETATLLIGLGALLIGCPSATGPSSGPHTESSAEGGCKDGEDNDHDGSSDCDDLDCRYAPACYDDSWGGWDTDDWDSGDWHDSGEDTGYDPGDGPIFGVGWTAAGLTLYVDNGAGTYTLGMAETDPASPDPWTGEDCFNGYTSGDGTTWLFCHPLGEAGGALATVGSVDEIVEGESTILSFRFEDVITYAVWSDRTGECWTWGHDPEYYAPAGCMDTW